MTTWYVTMVIPMAHAFAINRVVNELEQDSGDNLSQPLSPTATLPGTHKYGGQWMDDARKATYEALKVTMLTPAEGWPLTGGVTLQDALDAADALQFFAYTGPDVMETGPSIVRAAMLQAMGLHLIPDEL